MSTDLIFVLGRRYMVAVDSASCAQSDLSQPAKKRRDGDSPSSQHRDSNIELTILQTKILFKCIQASLGYVRAV